MILREDLYTIKSFLNDNFWQIATLVLLFICFKNCSSENHSTLIAEREATIKILEDSRDSFIKKNNELNKRQVVNKQQIEKAEKKITSLKKENKILKLKGDKQIAKLKKNDIKEWKSYYQDITNLGNKDIKVIDTSLSFTRKPLIIIANKIIKGEVATAQLSNANKVITETRVVANEYKNNYELEKDKNENLLSVILTDSIIKNNLNSNVSDLKKDLKKAKKPKLGQILIGVGAGIIVGVFIAN